MIFYQDAAQARDKRERFQIADMREALVQRIPLLDAALMLLGGGHGGDRLGQLSRLAICCEGRISSYSILRTVTAAQPTRRANSS